MNSVDRVKLLCKEKKIPISKLERDLGYSNGYIGQLRKGVFPSDRIKDIAEYLSVTVDYLMNGNENKSEDTYYLNEDTKEIAQKIFESKALRLLFDAAQDASPEDIMTTYQMLQALKKKERGEID